MAPTGRDFLKNIFMYENFHSNLIEICSQVPN